MPADPAEAQRAAVVRPQDPEDDDWKRQYVLGGDDAAAVETRWSRSHAAKAGRLAVTRKKTARPPENAAEGGLERSLSVGFCFRLHRMGAILEQTFTNCLLPAGAASTVGHRATRGAAPLAFDVAVVGPDPEDAGLPLLLRENAAVRTGAARIVEDVAVVTVCAGGGARPCEARTQRVRADPRRARRRVGCGSFIVMSPFSCQQGAGYRDPGTSRRHCRPRSR